VTDDRTQAEKFAELSRALECDEDEDRFKERLRQIVKHKPVETPEPPPE